MTYVLYSSIRLKVEDSFQWRSDLISYDSLGFPWHVHDALNRFRNFKVIFIANNPAFKKNMISRPIHKIIKRENKGMDFGAWKEALQYVPAGEDIILTNDSIFGFDDQEQFFKDAQNFDFYGLSYNDRSPKTEKPHVQSMLLYIKSHVVESKAFKNFFKNFDHTTNDKHKVIYEGEIAFTAAMKKAGFKPGWICKFNGWEGKEYHESRSPFLKIKHNEGIYNAIKKSKQNVRNNPSIDVVYPLGTGSNWDDNELRFSLRSIQKHLKDIRNVIIIGSRKPSWLDTSKVVWIWQDDTLQNNADGNIINKVLRACRLDFLSNKFLFINDDHLILKDMRAAHIAFYHKGDLINNHKHLTKTGNVWIQRALRTGEKLKSENKPTIHFDCHTPVMIDKKRFPEIMSQYNYEEGFGYVMKSLYLNNCRRHNIQHYEGFKKLLKDQMYRHAEINEMLQEAWFMSFQDSSLNGALMMWMKETFPEISEFEKTDFADKGKMEIIAWLNNPEDFELGVRIFNQNSKNYNLKKLYATLGDRPKARESLKHNLQKILEK